MNQHSFKRSLRTVCALTGACLLWLMVGIAPTSGDTHPHHVSSAVAMESAEKASDIQAPHDTYTTFLPLIARPAKAYIPLLSHWDSRYVQPGTYAFGYCHDVNIYSIYDGTTLAGVFRFCVDSVDVGPDFHMRFNVSWTLLKLFWPFNWAVKYSDYTNRNMNVTDNIGCRYDHIATGDAAAVDTYFTSAGERHTGWFYFPPACLESTVFTFHDDDQHFVITNLVLGHRPE